VRGRTPLRSERGRDDSGVVLILVALGLVIIVIFTAFAVDMGGLYAARRQDQTAADMGALAAVQEMANGESAIVDVAKSFSHDTLETTLTDAEWDTCPRPDTAALARQAATASCISYDGSQVRVRLPDQHWPAGFGQVVGIGDYRHSAFAIAGLVRGGFGSVLPYFVTSSQSANGYECLIADGPSFCDPNSGKFFQVRFSWHTPTCVNGGSQSLEDTMFENNTATGVDHLLSLFHGTELLDTAPGCPLNPNSAEAVTGNRAAETRRGLLLGSSYRDGDSARLRRTGDGGPSLPRTTGFGVSLDDTPLWWFIPPDYGPGESQAANIPTSCKRDQFVNSAANYYNTLSSNPDLDPVVATHLEGKSRQEQIVGLLVRCFKHYMGESWDGTPGATLTPAEPSTGCSGPCNDPVFAKNSSSSDEPDLWDIQYTPRFGYAPEVSTAPPGSSGVIHFQRFRALYLQRFTLGNNDVIWDPHVGINLPGSAPNNPNTAAQAFLFPDGMLPGKLGDADAPNNIGENLFIELVR
jgi:hypothetical protein